MKRNTRSVKSALLVFILLSGFGVGIVTAEQEPQTHLLASSPSSSASGRITLRVWDNGTVEDDEADVYFHGKYLGRSAPTARGTTWDLGDLAPGSYTLRLVHKVDREPPGTYAWELSGGGVFTRDDTAWLSCGQTITINVLANDRLTDVAAGATPELRLGETYEYTIQVRDARADLIVDKIVAGPALGTARISPDRKSVLYTAGAASRGKDSFQYRAIDPRDRSRFGIATVSVTVNCEEIEPEKQTDADGNPIDSRTPLQPTRSVLGRVLLPTLPDSSIEVRVIRNRDGVEVSRQVLTSDVKGAIDTVFLYDSAFDAAGNPLFDTDGNVRPELEDGFRIELRRAGQAQLERPPIHIPASKRINKPTIFPVSEGEQLRPGFTVGERVYVKGLAFPPNKLLPIYICRDRSAWEEGFPLGRMCTGTRLDVKLEWDAPVDLDLWVEDPFGNVAFFGDPDSPIAGHLSTDRWLGPASETFTLLEAPSGTYKIGVQYYRGTGAVPYTVTITINGKPIKTERGRLSRAGDEAKLEVEHRAAPLLTLVKTDSRGNIPKTLIWAEARLGDWDIVVDMDSSGTFTAGDIVWQKELTGFVVAEVGGRAAVASVVGGNPGPHHIRFQLASDKDRNYKDSFAENEPIYVWFNPAWRPSGIREFLVTVYIIKQGEARSGRRLEDVAGRPETIGVRLVCINGATALIENTNPKVFPSGRRYDVVIDVNNNGIYDEGMDFLDDGNWPGGSGYGFQVLSPIGVVQRMIEQAPDYGTVEIPPGVYRENIVIRANIRLIASGPGVLIQGDGRNPVVSIEGGVEATIAGFEIAGGSVGILADGAVKVLVFDCTIRDNLEQAITFRRSAGAIGRSRILGNRRGIVIQDGSDVRLNDTFITGNGGDGIAVTGSKAEINDSRILNNNGCGISADGASTVRGGRNTVENNMAGDLCGNVRPEIRR